MAKNLISGLFYFLLIFVSASGLADINPVDPVQDPAGVTAIPAKNWGEVKYIFCSAEGRTGFLIDLQGTNLSAMVGGKFRMARRACDGSQPFTWDFPGTFAMTGGPANVLFDFGVSAYGRNTIQTSEQAAFSGPGGQGQFEGHSGPCKFLTNMATRGLFDSQPVFRCR